MSGCQLTVHSLSFAINLISLRCGDSLQLYDRCRKENTNTKVFRKLSEGPTLAHKLSPDRAQIGRCLKVAGPLGGFWLVV